MSGFKKFIKQLLPQSFSRFLVREKKQFAFRFEQKKLEAHYALVEEKIKKRGSQPLRFASYVVFDSSFGAYGVMDKMFALPNEYTAKIVVIPDISRGEVHLREQYHKTKAFFEKKYGKENVMDGWNEGTGEFLDASNQFDVIYLANPYDAMVNKVHGIKYLITQQVLPVYISYGCMPDNYGCKVIMPLYEISLFWKVFADNQMSLNDYRKYELCRGKNVVLTGYAKMDDLEKYVDQPRLRKRIIIAPHHTITMKELPLSTFLENKDFILALPTLYPQIDFVFRPHPLLLVNMINEGFWTKTQADEYIEKVKAAGMEYSYGGDYLQLFKNSDGIIHDCSSFVVEYLFTGKPCCFMAKKNYKKVFSALGKACLKNYYLAFTQKDITKFLDDVIIGENDVLKDVRLGYAKKFLAINYPDVSSKILNEIAL